jgi:hypothetical protein
MDDENPYEPPRNKSRFSRSKTPFRMQFSFARLLPIVIVSTFLGVDSSLFLTQYISEPAAFICGLVGGALIGLLTYFTLEAFVAIVRSLRRM